MNVNNFYPHPPKRPIDVFRGKFEFGWLPLLLKMPIFEKFMDGEQRPPAPPCSCYGTVCIEIEINLVFIDV